MSSIWWASRPISSGTTWSVRKLATASSRPFSVASPMPVMPSDVSILSVTKLRPGQVMMTLAETILSTAKPHKDGASRLLQSDFQDSGFQYRRTVARHDVESARLDHPFHFFIPEAQRLGPQGEGDGLLLSRLEADAPEAFQLLDRPG